MCTATLPSEPRVFYRFETPDEDLAESLEEEAPATLDTYDNPPLGDPKFWRRQFGTVVTAKQRGFDWTMGVFMPLICFYFDPFVFREGLTGNGLLGQYRLVSYVLGFLTIMALSAWLLWGERLGFLATYVGIILFLASMVSLIVGIVLLPYSLLGMLILIGFLGFTPFFSSIVCLRNAIRVMRVPGT